MLRATILLALVCACGVPDPLVKEQGPQATAHAWNLAVERGDFGALYDLTRPRDRTPLIGWMMVATAGVELDPILKRHGLGTPPDSTIVFLTLDAARPLLVDYLKDVRDMRALYADTIGHVLRHRKEPDVWYGEPILWEIRGDFAFARMGGRRARFERVDGRWYMVQEVEQTSPEIHVEDE